MIKSLIVALCLLFPAYAQAELWGTNQILEATCRVTAGQYYGTGSCIKHQNGKYFILTNAHVVGNSSAVYLEFFKNGRKTNPLPAQVIWSQIIERTSIDFAIVAIDEKLFGKYPPRVATLAPISAQAVGGYIVSAGCPGARWPSAFEGFIIKQESDRILFYPPPLGGQSGSGLYIVAKGPDGYHTYLKGVVTWRIGGGVPGKTTAMGYEENHGGAVVIDTLLSNLDGKVSEPSILPENYEMVGLFNIRFRPQPYRISPRYTVKPQPKPTPKPKPAPVPKPELAPPPIPVEVVPLKEHSIVVVPEPIVDKSRLLPIINPDTQPIPTPDTPPVPQPELPNQDNPYDNLPDFSVPVEVPPVIKEIEELDEKNDELKEENDFYKSLMTWLGGLGGVGTVLAAFVTFLYKKGYMKKWWASKKDELEVTSDKAIQDIADRIAPIIGIKMADKVKNKADLAEDVLIAKIEAAVQKRLSAKLNITETSIVPVSEPIVVNDALSLTEAQNEVLNPVAIAVLDDEARMAIKMFVNRMLVRLFKDME